MKPSLLAVRRKPPGKRPGKRPGKTTVQNRTARAVPLETHGVVNPHLPLAFEGHKYDVFSVAWSPNGKWVASASLDGEVRVWDINSGDVILSVKSLVADLRYGSPLPAVLAWSPDSRLLAFPQANHVIGVVDAKTAETIQELKGHTDTVRTLAWSPAGEHLVSGGYDHVIRVWNPNTGQLEKSRNTTVEINTVCWRPDGKRIATGDQSGSVRIWDPSTGQQTLALSYPYAVPMVAWNPYGNSLACVTFGGDKTVRIWDATIKRAEGPYW